MEMQGQQPYGDTKGAYPPPGYGQQPYPQQAYQQQPYPQQPYATQPGVPGAATTTVVIQQGVVRPQSYLVLSCFVIWCCNCPMGIIAFVFSMLSSSAADEGDMEQARKMGRISMWVNIAAIIVAVLVCIVVVVLYVVYFNAIVTSVYDANANLGY